MKKRFTPNAPYFAFNDEANPIITQNTYRYIKSIIERKKSVRDRIMHFLSCGYTIKKCFAPNTLPYIKVGEMYYLPTLEEIRINIGRPINHLSREMYAIVIQKDKL